MACIIMRSHDREWRGQLLLDTLHWHIRSPALSILAFDHANKFYRLMLFQLCTPFIVKDHSDSKMKNNNNTVDFTGVLEFDLTRVLVGFS